MTIEKFILSVLIGFVFGFVGAKKNWSNFLLALGAGVCTVIGLQLLKLL